MAQLFFLFQHSGAAHSPLLSFFPRGPRSPANEPSSRPLLSRSCALSFLPRPIVTSPMSYATENLPHRSFPTAPNLPFRCVGPQKGLWSPSLLLPMAKKRSHTVVPWHQGEINFQIFFENHTYFVWWNQGESHTSFAPGCSSTPRTSSPIEFRRAQHSRWMHCPPLSLPAPLLQT